MDARQDFLRYQAVTARATLVVDGRELALNIKQLSTAGVCFVGVPDLHAGQQCRIRIVLDLGSDRFSEPLDLPIRVAWTTSLAGDVQTGAAFLPLGTAHRQQLESMIYLLTRDVAADAEGRLSFRTGLVPAVGSGDKRST